MTGSYAVSQLSVWSGAHGGTGGPMRSTGHTHAQPRGLTHVADASYINSSHKLHIKSMQHNIWSGGRSQPLPMPYARASEREQAITHQINKIQELHSLMQRRNVLWNHRATHELQPTPCGCLARASLHRAQPSTSAIPVSTDRSSPAQQLSQALAPYGKTPIEYGFPTD